MIEAAKLLTVLSVVLAFASIPAATYRRKLMLAASGGTAATMACLVANLIAS
jgi:hypothetical protein